MSPRQVVVVVLASFMALAVAYSFHAYDARLAARDTCQQIEDIKRILRPEPFNREETIKLLMDLGITPGSEVGERLLKRIRDNNAKDRADLAPRDCP